MYKIIRECGMPRWLKVLLNVLLTLTCIYWIGYLIFQFLEVIRKILKALTSEVWSWWVFIICIIILLVSLCFFFRYNPFLELWDWIVNTFYSVKDKIFN